MNKVWWLLVPMEINLRKMDLRIAKKSLDVFVVDQRNGSFIEDHIHIIEVVD